MMLEWDRLALERHHGERPSHLRFDKIAMHPRIPATESSEVTGLVRPLCQAWGGPRALNGRCSNEAGSLAANDHDNISVNKRGARMIARIGRTSVPAKLVFTQMAQKSPQGRAGFFCGSEPAEVSPSPPDSANTIGLSLLLLK
jgi:hypothetical protein